MKALSNSHPFMLAINEERETHAKSSIPDRCLGKEVGRKKEWKTYGRRKYVKRKNF